MSEDSSLNAGIRFASWGLGFCHIFGFIGVVLFGLSMMFSVLFFIFFVSSIASLYVRHKLGSWFGLRPILSGFPQAGEFNPDWQYFRPPQVKNTATTLILYGIITLPGSFIIGGALLLIGGVIIYTRAS